MTKAHDIVPSNPQKAAASRVSVLESDDEDNCSDSSWGSSLKAVRKEAVDEDKVPESQGDNTFEACFSDREEETEVIASSQDTDTDYIDESENGAYHERIMDEHQLGEGDSAATKPVVSPELGLFSSHLLHSFKYEFDGFCRELAIKIPGGPHGEFFPDAKRREARRAGQRNDYYTR